MKEEFLNEKEISKKMKKKNAFHVCGFYKEGQPLTAKTPDGRTVSFEIAECMRCKQKILITKETKPESSNTICTKCAFEQLQSIPFENVRIVINKKDKVLYEMAMDKMLEEILESFEGIGG